MRRILSTLMLLLTVAFLSFGQDIKPIDPINFKALQSPSFSYYMTNQSAWIYKGSLYGWTELQSRRDTLKLYAGKNMSLVQDYPNHGVTYSVKDSLLDIDFIDFTHKQNPIYGAYRLFADTTAHTLGFYNDEADITMQIGSEMWSRVYNSSGSNTLNGTVVRITGSLGDTPTVNLASNDYHVNADGVLGIATHDIETDTYGFITTIGEVHGLNTAACPEGAILYLGVNGAYTHIRPLAPNFVVEIGTCLFSDATDGTILVNIKGSPYDIVHNSFNDIFLESMTFRVTSNGTTTIGSLQRRDGGDLTMQFSNGFTTLDCTPATTVTLTAGTATVPQTNYVYVPKSTGVLTASTSGWPSEEAIRVAEVACRTSALTQIDGVLRNQNWNDHIAGANGSGHVSHINERIRRLNADWYSGVAPTLTIISAANPDNVYFSNTGGKVYQMHQQDFPAQTMPTDDIHVVNHFTIPYSTTNNLNTQLTDAIGGTLASKSYSLVIWGVQNESGELSHLMVNLPIGSYLSAANAIKDADNYSVYTIPTQFKGVGFLIARVTLSHNPSNSGTWTLEQTQDLRGYFPNNTAGSGSAGSGGGVTTYLGLLDTPNTYASSANKLQGVNSGETAIESKAMTVTLAGTANIPLGQQYQINGGSIVVDAISDGVTTTASSQNALFDALALKEPTLTKGNLTENTTGLEFSSTRQVIGGAATLVVSTGYVIPTTDNISHAETAYTHSQNDTDLNPNNEIQAPTRVGDDIGLTQTTTTISIADKAPASGSGNYIQNGTSQQPTSNFNISGNGTIAGNVMGGTFNNVTINPSHHIYFMGDSHTAFNTFPTQIGILLGSDWQTHNKGIAGNTTGQMLARFSSDVTSNSNCEYVVIMGGINDIIWVDYIHATTTEANLQSMYDAAHANNVKVVALTIMPTSYASTSLQKAKLDSINTWIKNTATNIDYIIDCYPLVDDPSNTGNLLPAYSLDGLHLNTLGYTTLGTFIYNNASWVSRYGFNFPTLIVDQISKINQDVTTNSTPTFQNVNLEHLANGYVPYRTGNIFENSPLFSDGTNIGSGTVNPLNLLHINKLSAGTESIPLRLSNNSDATGTSIGMAFSNYTGSSITAKITNSFNGADFPLNFYTWGSSLTQKAILTGSGHFGLGYFSGTEIDNYHLAVNGNAFFNGTITTIGGNSSNWNTAYGWGNHAGLYLPIVGGNLLPTPSVGVKNILGIFNSNSSDGSGASILIGTSTTEGQGNARISATAYSGYDYRSILKLQTTTNAGVWNSGLTINENDAFQIGTAIESGKVHIMKSDAAYNGSPNLSLSGGYATTKLDISIDNTNNISSLQSWQWDVNYSNRPLSLQPIGGRLLVGTKTDNGTDMIQVNGTVNSTGYLLNNNNLFSSLTLNTATKWDGTKFVSITNNTGYLFNDGSGNFSNSYPEGNTLRSTGSSADQVLVADGTNGSLFKSLKTINSNSIFGVGNIQISAGDVYKVGTPVSTQLGIWTGDGTIKGTTNLSFTDNTTFHVFDVKSPAPVLKLSDSDYSPVRNTTLEFDGSTNALNFYNYDGTTTNSLIKIAPTSFNLYNIPNLTAPDVLYYNHNDNSVSWGTAPSGGGMVYPAGSGIPLVVSGTSWGTTIALSGNAGQFLNGSGVFATPTFTSQWATVTGGISYGVAAPSENVGVGTAPLTTVKFTSRITGTAINNYSGYFNNDGTGNGVAMSISSTDAARTSLLVQSGGLDRLTVFGDGSIKAPYITSDATPTDVVYWKPDGTLTHGAKPSGTGGVSSVSASNITTGDGGNFATVTVTDPTTTPNIPFLLSSQTQRKVLIAPLNSSGVPTYRQLTVTDISATGTPSAATLLIGNGAWGNSLTSAVTGSNYTFSGINTSSGIGVYGTSSTGVGVRGLSIDGFGLSGISSTNYGVYAQSTSRAAGRFQNSPTSTNTLIDVIEIQRNSSGTASNGIGGGISFGIQTATGASNSSGDAGFYAELKDATSPTTRTTDFVWELGVSGSSPVERMRLTTSGTSTIGAVLKLTPADAAPSSPSLGMIYVNTNTHIYFYNGTSWVQMDN